MLIAINFAQTFAEAILSVIGNGMWLKKLVEFVKLVTIVLVPRVIRRETLVLWVLKGICAF